MYRQCDLSSGFDGRLIRATILEYKAKLDNIVTIPGEQGHWRVLRTHGYSTEKLDTIKLSEQFAKKSLTPQ